ncbi:MAG: response regulator transcription factor [Clostridia bacterium]|nr:response regulator transcription factor [Clostridia bacterium]
MKILFCKGLTKDFDSLLQALNDLGECWVSDSCDDCINRAVKGAFDMVIGDINLEDMTCVDFITKIRKKSDLPMVMYGNLDNPELVADILELGGDEYLKSPFNTREVRARVNAIIRRNKNKFNESVYEYGNIKLDMKTKMLIVDGKYVKLAGKMYDVIEYFIRNRNVLVSKEQLYKYVWGEECETVMSVTEVYVSNLRKILRNCGIDRYLQTVKNVGYIWNEDC